MIGTLSEKSDAPRLLRGAIVVAVSLAYLSYVFQLSRRAFWTTGLGDWIDPYFSNFLLENWHRSLWSLTDPSSPPMYFPVRGALGYSHGLVLYAPFYLAIRPFLHPFQAYTLALFLVIEAGIVCLYLIFRKFLTLSFIEALVLSAFFFSSQNVINEATGVWSQRASVFLIPPILLIGLLSVRMQRPRGRRVLAWAAGLLSMLLFTQDFYTALFALHFAIVGVVGVLVFASERSVKARMITLWKGDPRTPVRVAFVAAMLTVVWTIYVLMLGGGAVEIFGLRIASHDARRPALLALASVAVLTRLHRGIRAKVDAAAANSWIRAFILGGFIGCVVFLWIYLGPYREHHAFPEEQLMNALAVRDPSGWHSPVDAVRDLEGVYATLRTFILVFILGIVAWVPWFRIDRTTRFVLLWVLLISAVVLLIPLRLADFSLWKSVFERLPGSSVIRDPKRIIYVFELAVMLVTAVMLARLPTKSPFRIGTPLLMLVLLGTQWNPEVFIFRRPIETYDRWVGRPIDIAASCRSFFIKGASENYMSRSGHMWALYGVDSMFVSINHSIPTLNGYSAWAPEEWGLANPQEQDYLEAVGRWIERHKLTNVCEFDIEARTMKPALSRRQ